MPDFPAALADALRATQSRLDDALAAAGFAPVNDWKLDPAAASAVASEELDDLRDWLEQRWNGTPRDTAILNKFLKVLPGGDKLHKYSEAAPYLVAVWTLSSGAFFGHLDQIVLGGYTAATWLTERLSNEVAARTRRTNRRITERFTALVEQQLDRAAAWAESQAPARRDARRPRPPRRPSVPHRVRPRRAR